MVEAPIFEVDPLVAEAASQRRLLA